MRFLKVDEIDIQVAVQNHEPNIKRQDYDSPRGGGHFLIASSLSSHQFILYVLCDADGGLGFLGRIKEVEKKRCVWGHQFCG